MPDSSLRDRLNAWTWRSPDGVLDEAATSGEPGAQLLAEQFRERDAWYERVQLVVALGDASGPAGITELRQAATSVGPHTVDLRCAALLALAKRCGSTATADLLAGLSDRSGTVRRYAMLGLAAYGTADAWDVAFTQLEKWLKRPSLRETRPPEVVVAVCYLVRIADSDTFQALWSLLLRFKDRMPAHVIEPLTGLFPSFTQELTATPEDLAEGQRAVRSWFIEHCNGLFAERLQ